MELNKVQHIYFIGIGGIGMSALARYFVAKGKHVSGYDRTPSEITKALEAIGVSITYNDGVNEIPENVKDKDATLIVYTPAIPSNHKQLQFFKESKFQILKRAEVLGLVTKATTCLAVAGTHGKTTTTSILGHLLNYCDVPVTAFLGGVSENYNSNLILNGTDVTVVEADEFDRSFLTLSPNIAGITSMDADHLDIYGDVSHLEEAFNLFTKKIKPNGKLFTRLGLPIQSVTYDVDSNSDYTAINIKVENGKYFFDLKTPNDIFIGFELSLPGRHNLSNAVLALAMALAYGCPHNQLVKGLALYKGVKRRFSYHIQNENITYIDDYAHHPTEIDAVYQAVSEMFPNKKVLAIFQPHLFSRTQDFMNAFAASLSQFHQIALLDIYPARELPIDGINSGVLLNKIDNPNKQLINKEDILSVIESSDAQVVLTIGAGDIGEQVQIIKNALKNA